MEDLLVEAVDGTENTSARHRFYFGALGMNSPQSHGRLQERGENEFHEARLRPVVGIADDLRLRLAISAMQSHDRQPARRVIDQEDHILASTLRRAVIWAGAIALCLPRSAQVKTAHYLQPPPGQPLGRSTGSRFTVTVQQKILAHEIHSCLSVTEATQPG